MIRAGAGYSVALNPRTAAMDATQAALRHAGLRTADAAFCFASTRHGGAYPLLVRTVGEITGTPNVVGCGTIWAIANGREFEHGPSVAVLVFSSEAITVSRFFVPQLRNRAREVAHELADALRTALSQFRLAA